MNICYPAQWQSFMYRQRNKCEQKNSQAGKRYKEHGLSIEFDEKNGCKENIPDDFQRKCPRIPDETGLPEVFLEKGKI